VAISTITWMVCTLSTCDITKGRDRYLALCRKRTWHQIGICRRTEERAAMADNCERQKKAGAI